MNNKKEGAYNKALRVIESCLSLDQLAVADRFISNYFNSFYDLESYTLLNEKFFEKEKTFLNGNL